MAWTQADLDALDGAIKTGAQTVEYPDAGRITYRTLDEMLRIREAIKADINASAGSATTSNRYARFSRGL